MPSVMKGAQTPGKSILKTTTNNGAGASGQPQLSVPQSSAPTPTAWQTVSSSNTLKSNLASARNPSQAPRPTKSVLLAVPPTPSTLANQLGNFHLASQPRPANPAATAYNPSLGPTRSTLTTPYRATLAPSALTTQTTPPHRIQTPTCVSSGYTRRDFRLGDLLSAPFHTANTNPQVLPTDFRLTLTTEGPAYSKRRMLLVLHMHATDLFCLPLYSFSNRGLAGKPAHLKAEYVCVKNEGRAGFVNQGVYEPVEVRALRAVSEQTTVHLSGGLRVGYCEDIARCGRLTEKSYTRLVDVWTRVVEQAQAEPWRP